MNTAETLLPLTSDRTVLRRLRVSDLVAFQQYRHDPAVGLYQGWSPQSDDDAAQFLARMAETRLLAPGTWTQLGITERGSDLLIGDIGIFVDSHSEFAEVGFSINASFQGRGLASDAVKTALGFVFQHSGVLRFRAVTDDRNTACIRLLERIGMKRLLTASAQFRGEPCLEHTYEILAPSSI
jgi:RimJ/RimL family protein N-acetyltransferase